MIRAKELSMNRAFVLTAVALFSLGPAIVAVAASGRQGAPLVVALGDSTTYGYGLASRATQNYAALYTTSIGGKLANLAVPAYACQDVLDLEVPHMPAGAAVVIVNCGINDVGGFVFTPTHVTRVPAVTDAVLATAEKAFHRLLAQVRLKEPGAALYAVNLRHWQRMHGPEPAQFKKDVNAWNAMIAATHLRVIDLSDDARMYDPANFLSDEIHPNVAGSKAMAGKFESP
jgi:lysophospholipase L1-like esterase